MNKSVVECFEIVVVCLIPMLMTVPVAMLLCDARTSRKLRVSFGTVVLSAVPVTCIWGILAGIATRWEIYTIHFWIEHAVKNDFRAIFLLCYALIFMISALSAFIVVHYYQRRSKKDEHLA